MLWATRNLFRGITFFFAVTCYLDLEDLKKVFEKLYILQVVNLLLVLYQYFVLQHVQDEIGGIFGYGNGAGVNAFNALLMAYYINAYVHKKEPSYKLIVTIFSAFIIAALAEEKMTYVLFVIVLVYYVFSAEFSFRKLGIVIIGGAGLIMGLILLKNIYPDMYEVMVSLENSVEYGTQSFETGYRIPRIGALPIISQLFFKGDLRRQLFGLGFGNCETSNYSIFQIEFYNTYGQWNYRWFTHQWTFLECGYIGFGVFVFFFVACVWCMFRCKKQISNNERHFLNTGIIMGICSIVTMWYNATIKVDMCYIAYFGIAIGFVAIKNSFMKDNLNHENLYIINAKSP